eukprot:Nk52_evm6s322 gene=Nk52_evmTU6s322
MGDSDQLDGFGMYKEGIARIKENIKEFKSKYKQPSRGATSREYNTNRDYSGNLNYTAGDADYENDDYWDYKELGSFVEEDPLRLGVSSTLLPQPSSTPSIKHIKSDRTTMMRKTTLKHSVYNQKSRVEEEEGGGGDGVGNWGCKELEQRVKKKSFAVRIDEEKSGGRGITFDEWVKQKEESAAQRKRTNEKKSNVMAAATKTNGGYLSSGSMGRKGESQYQSRSERASSEEIRGKFLEWVARKAELQREDREREKKLAREKKEQEELNRLKMRSEAERKYNEWLEAKEEQMKKDAVFAKLQKMTIEESEIAEKRKREQRFKEKTKNLKPKPYRLVPPKPINPEWVNILDTESKNERATSPPVNSSRHFHSEPPHRAICIP